MKYIAYGSNMSKDQMARRCPDARFIGTGWLRHARLEFYLHATILPSRRNDDAVPVAVWDLTPYDVARLDIYEGAPVYYRQERCTVEMMDGSAIQGIIYIMRVKRNAAPTDSYYDGIRAAYVDLGFEREITRVLSPARKRSITRARICALGASATLRT